MIGIGEIAPDFTLPRTGNGTGETTLTLSALRPRPVVLYFYPKDDTSGCTAEAIEFNELAKDFSAAGAAILGASPDPVKKHDKFRDKYGLSFPLVADEDKVMLAAYGVWVEKSMYGKTYMGIERTTLLIDAEGRVAQVWPKVKVKGHAQEVLEAARILG